MKSNKLVFVTDNADVKAVATGVTKPSSVVRKDRARKKTDSPRAAVAVKKKKEPKPARNPFRRSETSKLHLKNLQMGKRVETMTPRVEILRKRLNVMQTRLDSVAGKLKLVKEELSTRSGASTMHTEACATATRIECVDTLCCDDEEEDEMVELDDEIVEIDDDIAEVDGDVEDGMDVLQTSTQP